jgi:hypothetical protein
VDLTQEWDARSGGSIPRRLRLAIIGLLLARGVMALCATPLFEGWDEYQHIAYIAHVQETGRRAVLKEDFVLPAALAATAPFPQPEAARVQYPSSVKPPSYDSFWRAESHASAPAASEVPPRSVALYQAQHSWWYYVLVSPLFRLLGGLDDLKTSVTGLRMLNLALTAGAVWIALGAVSARISDRRTAGWIALLIGVQPLIVMNGIRVSSDAAGMFFATAAIAAMLRLSVDGRDLIRRSCVVGLLVGAAAVLKATNLALLPALGVAWGIAVLRSRPTIATALGAGAAMVGLVGLVMAPDLAHNLAVYGVATPMQEAIVNRERGLGSIDLLRALWAFPFVRYGRWLFGEGLFIQGNWSFIAPIQEVTRLHWSFLEWAALGLVASAAVIAARWAMTRFGRRGGSPGGGLAILDSGSTILLCAAVCGGYFAALLYHAVQSSLAWGVTTTGPWYAAPALPWFLLLIGVGARGWPRLASVGLVAALVFLGLTAEHVSRWYQLLPVYSGGAEGFEALRRVAGLQAWFLGTVTYVLAAIAGAACLLAAVRMTSIVAQEPGAAGPASRALAFDGRLDGGSIGVPAPAGATVVQTERRSDPA